MTAVTEVWSATTRLFAGMWCPLASVITTLYYVAIIFQCRVWYCVLSLHVFGKIKVRDHPHPLIYLCAKFCFFCVLHCWASPRKKQHTQSLTQHRIFDAPGTKALALWKKNCFQRFTLYPELVVCSIHEQRDSAYVATSIALVTTDL